ncbi:hypothetical protein ACQ86N_23400 [Puia sp. P3]|uniref:hypothetical protein n=1 Tax=Puia sp. P3 TaxID=3423952 RepID=UPI003D669D2C
MLGEDQEKYLDGLLQQDQSFFIHERLSPEMRALLWELRMPPAAKVLQRLFYQVRIQQLVYLLLEQLNQRTAAPHKNSNSVDVARVFKARQLLLRDLSSPPTIAGLARGILMSESQLKQSFREIFGVSIYQYFQNARLEKARRAAGGGGKDGEGRWIRARIYQYRAFFAAVRAGLSCEAEEIPVDEGVGAGFLADPTFFLTLWTIYTPF